MSTHSSPAPRYVPTEEAAKYSGIPANTLRAWRAEGRGPNYYKPAGRVLYDLAELDEYLGRPTPPAPEPGSGQFVYLVECAGFHKIGIARDVQRRFLSIQSHCPLKCTLVFYAEVKHSKTEESRLHERYKSCWVRGEWFRLTIGQVEEIRLDLNGCGKLTAPGEQP